MDSGLPSRRARWIAALGAAVGAVALVVAAGMARVFLDLVSSPSDVQEVLGTIVWVAAAAVFTLVPPVLGFRMADPLIAPCLLVLAPGLSAAGAAFLAGGEARLIALVVLPVYAGALLLLMAGGAAGRSWRRGRRWPLAVMIVVMLVLGITASLSLHVLMYFE